MNYSSNDPLDHAFRAHFRQPGFQQPSQVASGLEAHGGEQYAVLRNGGGILSVYRVQPSGKVRGLKRWPAAIRNDW